MTEPQKHIDLSFNIKRPLSRDELENVPKVDAAPKNNENSMKLNSRVTEIMLGTSDVNLFIPKRVNRAAMKIEAARVSFLLQRYPKNRLTWILIYFRRI